MTELEKLDRYLTEHKYPHVPNHLPYFDADGKLIVSEFNQIVVFERSVEFKGSFHEISTRELDAAGCSRSWDAICYFGTYGHADGLLEIAGDIVEGDEGVEGWLTADDIIARLEARG